MKKFRITFNSPVVLWFSIMCFGVTLIDFLANGLLVSTLFMTYHSSLADPLTYIRFFTHVIGHDGWSHLFGNLMYILLLGPMIEEKYGSKVLIKVILIAAVATGVINYIFFPNTALCGASGVVFALIVLSSFTGFKSGEIPLTFILVAAIFLGQQIYEGIVKQDNISNMAHIIGGIVGGVNGFYLNKKA